MIIRSRAPLRLGLAGGGSDLSPYCDLYGGVVLNATINLFAYCTIKTTSDGKIQVFNTDSETSCVIDHDDMESEVSPMARLPIGVYRYIQRNFPQAAPLSCEIYISSDAPPGSGLGGSSTLVVAILKAFVEWLRLPLGEYDIARAAWEIERVDLGLSGGKQDQYAATFGGINFIEFYAENKVIVNPLRVKTWMRNELEDSLVLYFTGHSRESAKIISQQIESVDSDQSRLEAMHRVKEQAYLMKEAVLTGNTKLFAQGLRQGWEAKKATSDAISNAELDAVYDRVMEAGGIAGKMSGAGGGGFFLFYVSPERRPAVVRALGRLGGSITLPQFSQDGTRGWILYE